MADEQIIYLSPEEELTRVRERLEGVRAQRIILIIPAQTQLTGLPAWRLLHARMHELKKSVLVISADRRIQSVAKLAGFHVAASLASAPPGQASSSQQGASTARHSMQGKNAARPQAPPDRGASRPSVQQRPLHQQPPLAQNVETPFVAPDKREESRSRRPSQDLGSQAPPAAQPYPPHPQERGAPFDLSDIEEELPYERTSRQYGAPYNYTVEPAPIFPLSHYADDDDVDQLAEDFMQAQDIRQSAALNKARDADQQLQGQADEEEETRPPSSSVQPPDAALHETESGVHDATAYPAPNMPGAGSIPSTYAPARNSFATATGRNGSPEPKAMSLPMPGSTTRTGTPQRQPTAQPQSSRTRNSRGLHWPRLHWPPFAALRPRQAAPAASRSQRTASAPPPTRRSAPAAPQAQGVVPRAKRRASPFELPLIISLVILFIFAMLAYFGPSADVTVALAAQEFSFPMTLTANTASKQNLVLHTVPAQTLAFDTSAQGKGHATGSVQVGMDTASGNVVFKYNGPGNVDIPSGVILSTSSGVQFTTQADTFVGKGNVLPTPVLAQNAGPGGNVPANSIVKIPLSSLNQIQQANPSGAFNPADLTVTNNDKTTGGGTSSVPAVSNADLSAEKAALGQQLQASIQAWLQKQQHTGDVPGKPVTTESLSAPTPAVGVADKAATFTITLKAHVTVLVVRAAALETAATAEFNQMLNTKHPAMALLPQQQITIIHSTSTPAKDGSSLTISFTAMDKVGKRLSADSVRNFLAGKSLADARQGLTASDPQDIKNVAITVHPSFFPWAPFFTRRINVSFIAATAPPPSHPAPKPGLKKL